FSVRDASRQSHDGLNTNAQRPTLNVQHPMSKPVAFSVGCSTFDVRRFLSPHGRAAESGLRHSTRNRAWGNPPWVQIPPLPPFAVTPTDRSGGDRRFARRHIDVDAFAILSAACVRNVTP